MLEGSWVENVQRPPEPAAPHCPPRVRTIPRHGRDRSRQADDVAAADRAV